MLPGRASSKCAAGIAACPDFGSRVDSHSRDLRLLLVLDHSDARVAARGGAWIRYRATASRAPICSIETFPFVGGSDDRRRRLVVQIVQTKRGLRGRQLPETNRAWPLLKPSGTDSVLSPRGNEAPGDSRAVVTDLSTKPVRQGVDLDVILRRDSELCDQRQDGAN